MILLLILLTLLIAVITFTTLRIFYGFKPPLNIETGSPADIGFEFQQISIPTQKNKKLFGWFIPAQSPDNTNKKAEDAKADSTLIMVHGWGGNAEFALPLTSPFRDKNINLLLFDHRNHGKSDKDIISTIGTMSEDVGAVIDWLKSSHPETKKIAVIGHSIGGAAVLHQASLRKDIDAVLILSTFAHIRKIVAVFLHRFGVMKSHIPGVISVIEKLIGHSLDDLAPVNTIQQLRCPALIMHGTADQTIPYADFEEICKAATDHNIAAIRCLTLPEGEHFPIEEVIAKQDKILAFLNDHNILSKP